MRLFYLLLKITLNYSMRVFYPRLVFKNAPKEFFGRTIYVSNHPASFMDPLAIGGLGRPIIFFTARQDIFNRFTQPILWACHMFPLYRAHDGRESVGKNEVTFAKSARILSFGRNLLVFGEGFTDDVFIRRLKPVKKGAMRIGFYTMEKLKWEKKIYMAAVGINYSDPNQMRSDLLISTSDKICLNDYEKEYKENPNKALADLTRRVEQLLREQITYIEDKNLATFHEQIMMITRKGMNAKCFDRKYSLTERWNYSRELANWMNEQDFDSNKALVDLKSQSENYFDSLNKKHIQEQYVYWKKENPKGSRLKELLMMVLLFPFAIIGMMQCFIPFILAKNFAEKSFKRKVFWGSVKLIGGQILIAAFNIPFIFVFYYFVYPSWWLAIAYFFSVGLTGLSAYMWFVYLNRFITKGKVKKTNLNDIIEQRNDLEKSIRQLIPTS